MKKLLFLFCLFISKIVAAPEISGFDFIEFYVGSAKASAYWHARALGFDIVAYSGPETGYPEKNSYYLKKNNVQLVITSAVKPSNFEVASFVQRHGDGVKRIGYQVDNVSDAFDYAYKNGAVPLKKPYRLSDEKGTVELAHIKLYDDTEIVLVDTHNYDGLFLPGYGKPLETVPLTAKETNLDHIDHIVGNVRENEMLPTASYLNDAFNFSTFVDFKAGDIATRYSALLSQVVKSSNNKIKHPINEPYFGLKKSQIEEYLDEYYGSGVQHIAITTENILETVANMRKNGVQFLDIPDSYYSALKKRQLEIREDVDELKSLGILCDLEGSGYLLQIFTKPVGDRPTFFYEIIQRVNGAEGFGKGNFQALFEAIEREQEMRGNL